MLKIKEYEQIEMILYTMDELVPEERFKINEKKKKKNKSRC